MNTEQQVKARYRKMIDLGYTQTSIAEAAGLHQSHLCLIMKGKRPMSLNTLQDLITAMNGSISTKIVWKAL